jgi:hypothetical protein
VTDDIPANIITLAKMATQAAETFLANATSGVAVPTALAVAEQTLIGRITSGHIVGLTVAQIKTLLAYAIGDLATIATDTVLTNSTAGSAAPAALALAEQTILGRITGGHIVGLTAAQILTLVNVAAGAQVNVLEGVTGTAPIVAGAIAAKSQAISISAATTSVPGSMSSADKTKLDGIAASANNYVHPNHSGEVTSAGDGAQTIAAKAVTLAKMADLAANSIIGNNTGSPATPLALSVAQVIALLGVTPTDLLAIARGWYFS